jgi:phosphate:Na+ symporter
MAQNELIDIHNQVASYIEFVNDAVANENTDILSKATTRSDIITHMIKDCRNRHLARVGTDQTTALKSLFFTDILTSYRRIKDHAFNIAEAQAGEK